MDVIAERLDKWFSILEKSLDRLTAKVETQNGRIGILERQVAVHLTENVRIVGVETKLDALIEREAIGQAITKDRAKLVVALATGANAAAALLVFRPWEAVF